VYHAATRKYNSFVSILLDSFTLIGPGGSAVTWDVPEGTDSVAVLNRGLGFVNCTVDGTPPVQGAAGDGLTSAFVPYSGQAELYPPFFGPFTVSAVSNQMLTLYVAAYGPVGTVEESTASQD
jgi:hypothetical protein